MNANLAVIFNQSSECLLRMDLVFLTLAISTFYRKSFTFRAQADFLAVNVINFMLWSSPIHGISKIVILVYKVLLGAYTFIKISKISFDSQDIINNSVMLTFLHAIARGRFSLEDLWIGILIISPLQLIRRPIFLKNALRPLRVSAGPISIILAIVSGASQAFLCLQSTNISVTDFLLLISSLVVVTSALLAGVVFRPDNTQVLDLFWYGDGIKYNTRVEYHATANAAVLGVAFLRVLLF